MSGSSPATGAAEGPPGGSVAVRTPRSRAGEGLGRAATLGLVAEMVRRDLALHYRHTRLGVLWAILPPLVAAGAIDLFLGRLWTATAASPGVPNAAFLYAGLVPWQFFSRAVTSGVHAVLGNGWILAQVPFPRIVLPASVVLTGFVDYLLGSLLLLALLIAVGHAPGASLLWLPLALGPLVLLGLAGAILLSALTVVLRDVQHATPYAARLLLLASPVLYPLAAAGGAVRGVLLANPVTGALEAHRAAWLGESVNLPLLGLSWAASAALLAVSIAAFRRLEPRFGDLL